MRDLTAETPEAEIDLEQILAQPRSRLPVVLRQEEAGVTLQLDGKIAARCPATPRGIQTAFFMAKALGVKIPALGEQVETQVSTGVIWRAVSISFLDLGKPESSVLLQRYLEESEVMRETSASSA